MKEEYFWSLIIEPSWVQAAIWTLEEQEKKSQVVSTSLPTHWESESNLVEVVDTVLSAAIQNLTDEIPEPNKVVFGVSPSWVSQGQIKAEHLNKIKEVCSKLSLTPAGFVVLPEALSFYFKSKEKTPLSAVVIGAGEKSLDVSLFNLGNLVGSVTVARSLSVVEDVVEALVRFSQTDSLPSRFIVYNGKEGELEEVKQALTTADWTGDLKDKVKFLHTPKIESISPKEKTVAVCLAGASEIGEVSTVVGDGEKDSGSREEKSSPEDSQGRALTAADVGFSLNQEATQMPAPQAAVPDAGVSTTGIPATTSGPNLVGRLVNKIKNLRIGFLKRPGWDGISPQKALLVGGVAFLVLLVGLALAWWFLPRATVTIFIAPKTVESLETVVLDTDAKSPDFKKLILPAGVLETEVDGEKTRSTSGAKVVGERAVGEVTIYRTGSEITLAAGTVLTGPNDLEFTLDESVKIASGSAVERGETKTMVTARDIGAEYNLASGSTFAVGNYPGSEIGAKNEADFSGGSSREIAAVSESDREELEAELIAELVEQAKTQIQDQISEDQVFVGETTSYEVLSREFSGKVGDEAENLKLDLKLNVSGFSVAQEHFGALAMEILKDEIPGGFVLREDQLKMEFNLEDEEGKEEVEVTFVANLLPDLNLEKIAQSIAGKYPPLAQSYLATIPGFTRAEVSIRPRFPGRLGTLPRIIKNISIEVSAER